jgi:hypothetical protein
MVNNLAPQGRGRGRGRGRGLEVGAGELTDGAAEVMRLHGQVRASHAALAMKLPEVIWSRPGALELGDGLFDDGVATVVGLHLGQRQGAVSDEGVVVPGGDHCELRTRRRVNSADHEADASCW